jgi:hypothetical protein
VEAESHVWHKHQAKKDNSRAEHATEALACATLAIYRLSQLMNGLLGFRHRRLSLAFDAFKLLALFGHNGG